ncbi:hypothetical protein SNE40_017689 [Patella caerulea]|uniref:Craniofacial development protein 1 n=1 Tax=Patella caerulea TaxID=87958 RepID=A0AAN8PEJ2_PATCE
MSDEEDYDSEEDVDYVPQAEDVSEEDNSGDEEDLSVLGITENITGSRRKKTSKSKKDDLGPRKRQGGIKLENEECNEEENTTKDEENLKLAKEIANEKVAKKVEQEKKRADDLWSSFLSDVKPAPKRTPSSPATPTITKNTNGSSSGSANVSKKEETPVKTMKITKVFDFAGEEVKITKEVSTDSKEAQKELKKQEESKPGVTSPSVQKNTGSVLSNIGIKRPGAGGGLGGVLNKIGKKQKMSVLDKSKMDWNSFKKDEGIEDDLKLHNNSKEGYIERMKFLQRTDLRQFEIEKNLRMSSSRK